MKNNLKIMSVLVALVVLSSCSGGGSSGDHAGGTPIGPLPNGSQIVMNPGSFNTTAGSSLTGTLSITSGSSTYVGVSSLIVTTSSGKSTADMPQVTTNPPACLLDSTKPSITCSLVITIPPNVPNGSYILTTTMINETTQATTTLNPVTITVQAAPAPGPSKSPSPPPPPPPGSGKTVTFVNKCSQTVWFAVGDASTNAIASDGTLTASTSCGQSAPGTTCPTGSTCINPGNGYQCFWDVPKPANGNYELATGQTNSVSIPTDSYDSLSDKVWGGVFGARMGCNTSTGVCSVGGCPTVNGGTDMTCAAGRGLNAPITQAEVTFKRIDTDYYDVEVINGATIAVSLAPDTPVSGNNAYYCGTPGATTAVNGLPASNWTFTPPSIEYNYVDGTVLSNPPTNTFCSLSNPTCSGGKVCGYTTDAVAGSSAKYQLSCGNLLGYYSSSQLYSLNQSSSNTALNNSFNTTQAGSPYSNGTLALCANPPLQSGYNKQATNVTCGCTNWSGLASPTNTCATINPAWTSFVLPTINWAKEACPTCYTYPFDDKSSSYRCHSTGTTNTMNYTVTFCPNN